jgi:hypothetical protein
MTETPLEEGIDMGNLLYHDIDGLGYTGQEGVSLQRATTSQPSNGDIYDMLLNITRTIEQNHVSQLNEISILCKRLSKCEEHLSMLVAAIAISPTLRANVVRDVNTGQYTRQVMYKIPVIVAFCLWTNFRPNQPFPCSYDYLCKLFSRLIETFDLNTRQELGSIFCLVLETETNIKIQTLSSLLADTSCKYSSIMRKNIMDICHLVRGPYAFLIPKTLSEFLYGFNNITSGGIMEFIDNPVQTKDAISAGAVYHTMSEQWLSHNDVLKAIQDGKIRRTNIKYLKNLCTFLLKGRIPTDQENKNMGFNTEKDMLDELCGNNSGFDEFFISSMTNKSISNNSARYVNSKDIKGRVAQNMFKPVVRSLKKN